MSAHTYNNQQYLPVLDRFFSMGGATQSSGYPWQTTEPYDPPARLIGAMTLDMALAGQGYVGGLPGTNPHRGTSLGVNLPGARAWAARDWFLDHADPGGALSGMVWRLNSHTAYRTEAGRDVIYFKSNTGNLSRIELVDGDYRNDNITIVGKSWDSYEGTEQGSALDTGADIFLAMGWYDAPFVGWNLKTAGPDNRNFVVASRNLIGPGAAEFVADITASMTFGLLFDERRNYFVLWSRGGRTYALRRPADLSNLSTGWHITRMSDHATSPRPATIAEMAAWSTYRIDTGVSGKWKRSRTLDVYVGLQDGVEGTVWLFKPAGWVDPRAP